MDASAGALVGRKPVLAALVFSAIAVGVLGILPGPASATQPGDNGRIAFSSDRDGDFDIYTMNPDGTDVQQLTNDPANDFNAAWSPDGSKIAFASDRGGGLYDVYVMSATPPATPTQLTTNAANDWTPNWSPDGTQIVLGSERDATPSTADDENVYKMNADGTGQTQLTNDVASDGGPAYSPDGSKIVFRSKRGGCPTNCYWELFTMNADGSNETGLTDNDEPYEVTSSWSPDGTQIVFQVNPAAGTPIPTSNDIWRIDADGTDEVHLTTNGDSEGGPTWSPDGSKVVFDGYDPVDENFEIYTMAPNGSGRQKVATNAANDLDADWQRLYYARPQSANLFRASLVPAQKACLFANNTHGAPASYISCSPPKAESSRLTVGTPTANGNPSQSSGTFRVDVINPTLPTEDDQLTVSLTDVRCRGASGGCAGAMEDYTGDLLANVTFRITDKYNGAALNDPATMVDLPFSWSVPCTATGLGGIPNAIGSACASVTTANALIPGFVKFGQRQMIELGQARVLDGGADGSAATGGDNSLFQIQGVFNP
jgi:Tol biopolymer transport system component